MNTQNNHLILINNDDKIIGIENPKHAHKKENLKLHRGFSVFIFNTDGELLIQKRSNAKLVYPGHWTNSVCSHPYMNDLSFSDPILDCKKQAVARIEYELGICGIFDTADLIFMDRFLYFSDNEETLGYILDGDVVKNEIVSYDESKDYAANGDDGVIYGEFVVDYMFYCMSDKVPCFNAAEIQTIAYVTPELLEIKLLNENVTPWLRIIYKKYDIFNQKRRD